MRLEDLATDPTLEDEGAWEDLGGGSRIKVARRGNPKYKAELQRLLKPYARQLEYGTMDEEVARKLMGRAMSRGLLTDWEIEGEGPYTPERGEEVLNDRRYVGLRQLVDKMADDEERFRARRLEEDAQSLGNGSAGSSKPGPSSKSQSSKPE